MIHNITASRNIIVLHRLTEGGRDGLRSSRFTDRHEMQRPRETQLRSFTVLSRLFIQELRVLTATSWRAPSRIPARRDFSWDHSQRRGSLLYLSFRDTQPHPFVHSSSSYGSFLSPETVTDRGKYKSGPDSVRLSRLRHDLSDAPVELTAMRSPTRSGYLAERGFQCVRSWYSILIFDLLCFQFMSKEYSRGTSGTASPVVFNLYVYVFLSPSCNCSELINPLSFPNPFLDLSWHECVVEWFQNILNGKWNNVS